MPTFTHESTLPAPIETVWAWHTRPHAFTRLTPPWIHARLLRYEGVRNGARSTIDLGYGPFHKPLIAEHRDVKEGASFRDVQMEGPFSRWEHLHEMQADGPERTTLRDEVTWELPSGLRRLEPVVRQELARMFDYRHRILAQDLAAHQRYGTRALRVAITGASGLIGTNLVAFLTTGGHRVSRLVRRQPRTNTEIYWDPQNREIDNAALEGFDAVVHLAGENVFALRWNEAKKNRILRSRTDGTQLLSETLADLERPPAVLVSASGTGYYGDRNGELLDEESPAGRDSFLADVCAAWEEATGPAQKAGIRTVRMRTGVVLTPAGGALRLMLPAFQMGLGARAGRRDQYFPWIGMDDALLAYYHAITTRGLSGAVNLTAPEPVTMEGLTRTLARVLHRPAFLAAPPVILRRLLGEAADEILLTSARVHPRVLLESGYAFAYPELEQALRHLLGRTP